MKSFYVPPLHTSGPQIPSPSLEKPPRLVSFRPGNPGVFDESCFFRPFFIVPLHPLFNPPPSDLTSQVVRARRDVRCCAPTVLAWTVCAQALCSVSGSRHNGRGKPPFPVAWSLLSAYSGDWSRLLLSRVSPPHSGGIGFVSAYPQGVLSFPLPVLPGLLAGRF